MLDVALPADAVYVSRLDPDDVLGSVIARPFELDGQRWLTAEHYYQAMKYPDRPRFQQIIQAPNGLSARKLGEGRLKRKRKDWAAVRVVIMTRALYTQARSHEDFAAALLATEQAAIFNRQQYDYFWGMGRDLRGSNHYGDVLMRVRDKLRAELE